MRELFPREDLLLLLDRLSLSDFFERLYERRRRVLSRERDLKQYATFKPVLLSNDLMIFTCDVDHCGLHHGCVEEMLVDRSEPFEL